MVWEFSNTRGFYLAWLSVDIFNLFFVSMLILEICAFLEMQVKQFMPNMMT